MSMSKHRRDDLDEGRLHGSVKKMKLDGTSPPTSLPAGALTQPVKTTTDNLEQLLNATANNVTNLCSSVCQNGEDRYPTETSKALQAHFGWESHMRRMNSLLHSLHFMRIERRKAQKSNLSSANRCSLCDDSSQQSSMDC